MEQDSKEFGVARVLGKGWAHVQHGMDRVIQWGMHRIKVASAPDAVVEVPTPKKTAIRRIGSGVRTGLRFLGTLGETYFDEYEKLKRKKR